MPLFGKDPGPNDPFRKNDAVVATVDLRGVPAGTRGKVKLINGFDWLRYWVFFDNGVDLGSIDQAELVRPQHWKQFQIDREKRIEAEALAAEAALHAPAGAETAGAASEAAADPNDPLAALRAMVPTELIERSAAARVRLGVPKP